LKLSEQNRALPAPKAVIAFDFQFPGCPAATGQPVERRLPEIFARSPSSQAFSCGLKAGGFNSPVLPEAVAPGVLRLSYE
jgi:hypothetical protein